MELRNTPRADGRSPAQVLYGRPLRSAVPAHHRAFADSWQRAAEECDKRAAVLKSQTVERYDASAHTLKSLRVGQHVLLQDPKTGLWDRTGAIVGVGSRRDYHVRLPSGRTYWRNRRYLRPLRPMVTVSPGGGGGARDDCSGTTRSTRCDKNQDDDTVADTGGTCAAGDVRGGVASDRVATPEVVPVRRSTRNRKCPQKLSVNWSDPVYRYV